MEYILGGAFLAIFVLFNRSNRASGEKTSRFKSMTAKAVSAVLLVGGLSFLAVELYAAKKIGALSAPDVGEVASDAGEWQALSKQFLSSIDGFAVFSSNRDGNHDIFRLNFKDYTLVKVTDHAHTETYPRISPDGQRLVFSRSQQPWVSQRNSVAWDVYLLDLETGVEKIIDSNATAPHWVSDTEITYLKNATTVIKTNVDDLQQELIYQTGVGNRMPEGSFIQNPKYNPDTKQIVFTGRQNQIGINSGHWGTAITLGDDHRGLYNGCELGWTSDGKMLYQVTTGGRDNGKVDGGLKIVSVDPKSYESKTLIDLDGEFSHEYWPKDSSNGEYLIFGASRGSHDHEHDTKDYEIFLWKTGSDSSKATRLTFHTGNENWPDVYIAN